MTTRIELDMDADAYRASEGISASDLKHIVPPKTPAHYFANVSGRTERVQTKAMLLGTLAHLAVLEPHKLDAAFAVRPAHITDLRTKEGKEWKSSVGALPVLDQGEADALHGMRDAVAANAAAAALLRGASYEVSLWAEHPATGLPIKGRLDALGAGVIADVKTCEDASPQGFGAAAARFLYDLSAAHYMALADLCGRPVDSFWWIAVEKSAPFAVAVYQPSEEVMARGIRLAEAALARVAECCERQEWPGYPASAVLQYPVWALREGEG
jgi:hypothetical protein